MAGDAVIQEVKDRLDIVEVVSGYLQLKKAGASWRACCPFHQEKTPSFFVSPDRQSWHCFGCGEGGDVIGFVMRMEAMEFPEALRMLAEKAGVKLPERNDRGRDERRGLVGANRMAARYWQEVLRRSPAAERARRYVAGRGLDDGTLDEFLIGYAPDSWETTSAFLRKKGFSDGDLVKAGLAAKRERGAGIYDKFRGRLMFPIRDAHGDVVGFTGRVLPGTDGKDPQGAPKYVNTQQTDVYNKGRVLYGLDLAKQDIRREDLAVVVEGNMDVIASHQADVRNVVASSGTALTNEQLDLLKRLTSRLVLSFDKDAAGETAARRGIDAAVAAGFSVRILRLPDGAGKDPDECVRKDVALWKKAIADAVPHMRWYLELAEARTDMQDPDAKRRASSDLIAEVAKLPQAVERTHWVREIARLFETPESLIFEEVQTARKAAKVPGAVPVRMKGPSAPAKHRERDELLAEHALALALSRPPLASTLVDALTPAELPQDIGELYTDFVLYYNEHRQGGNTNTSSFCRTLEGRGKPEAARQADVIGLLGEKEFGDLPPEQARATLVKIIGELEQLHVSRRKHDLLRAMAEAERSGDDARIEEVQRQLHDLI